MNLFHIKNRSLIFGATFLLYSLMSLSAYGASIKTIGISTWTGYPANVKGFKEAMETGGFVEGKSVRYLFSKSGPDKEKQRKLMNEFRDANVDMVYSLTTPGTIIAKEILPETTPIVFSIVTYPADSGLIESFEYSGNNLVGTSNYVPIQYYVNLLSRVLPSAKTVAVFHRKGEPNSKIQSTNLIRLFRKKGITAIDVEALNIDDLTSQATKLISKVDAFVTTTDTLMQSGGEKALIKISLTHNIPILSSNKSGIQQGATFGPVVDFHALGKMAGKMAVSILRDGMKPSHIQSRLQEPPLTLINRKSADKIGMIIDDNLQDLIYINETLGD